MDFLKKIFDFLLSKLGGSSSLVNIDNSTNETQSRELSDLNINNNTGDVKIAGRDVNE